MTLRLGETLDLCAIRTLQTFAVGVALNKVGDGLHQTIELLLFKDIYQGCTVSQHIIKVAVSKSQELLFFDKGEICHNMAVQMKHLGAREMPRPTYHIPDVREHGCLVQIPAKRTP